MTATATTTRTSTALTFQPKATDRWNRPVATLVDAKGKTVARVTTLPDGSEETFGGKYMVELYGTKDGRFSYHAKSADARKAATAGAKAVIAAKAAAAAEDAAADALVTEVTE